MQQGRQGGREARKRGGKEGRIGRKEGLKEGTEGESEGRRQEERGKGGNESTMEGYFGYMRMALGILERLGGHFGVTLGLLWGHLGVTLAPFWVYDGGFG